MSVTEAITALTAVGALVFTGLSLNATRDQVAAVQQQNEVSEQGQFTDRYTKAVEQLDRTGQEHLQARLGAIYALERLAHDSPRDQPTIIEILSAFVRSNRSTSASVPNAAPTCPAPQPLTLDAKAALTVLGRRNNAHDNGAKTSLNDVCLNGADLGDVVLRGADLSGAVLRGAVLIGADLGDVILTGADLSFADLSQVDLTNADLTGANLRGANHDSGTVVVGVLVDPNTVEPWW